MPVKVFVMISTEPPSDFEDRVNRWLADLEADSVRNISTSAVHQSGMQLAVTIWYEEGGMSGSN
jgi:hypothetical protein